MSTRNTTWRLLTAAVVAVGTTFTYACTDEQDRQDPIVAPPNELIPPGGVGIDLNDLTLSPVFIGDAVWEFPVPANVGTGNINPFLTIQNNPTEIGFNTDASPLPLDAKRPSFTDALPLNIIPIIAEYGGFYREIIFDANESDSSPDAQFTIEMFELYICDDPDAPDFDAPSDFDPSLNSDCQLVYELPQRAFATDAGTQGSGNALDYRILIPEDAFDLFQVGQVTVDDCPYNPIAAPCGLWVILYTRNGTPNAAEFGGEWTTGATFEEYSTVIRPFVTVEKDAEPFVTLTHDWSISKTVNGGESETIILPPGGSDNVSYAIAVDYLGATQTAWSAGGDIVITNPGTGGNSGEAVVVSAIADTIDGTNEADALTCTGPDGAIADPANANQTLEVGESINCTWSETYVSNPGGGTHINEVYVSIDAGTFRSATAEFSFSSVPTANVTHEYQTVDFTDQVLPGGTVEDLGSCTAPASGNGADQPNCTAEAGFGLDTGPPPAFTYSVPVADPGQCDLERVNRATIVQTGFIDEATLNVLCFVLTVTKTAVESYTTTYLWDLEKSVTPEEWDLFDGESGTSDYGVDVTLTDQSDNDWRVQGTIQITSPAQAVNVTVSSVTDMISGYGPAIPVICTGGLPQVLAPGGSINCTYDTGEINSPDSNPFGSPNTARATLQSGAFFEGTAPVDFGEAVVTEVDKVVTIEDDVQGTLGTCTAGATPLCVPESGITFISGTFGYSTTFTCDADEGEHSNTADLYGDEDDLLDTDTETVDVDCYSLSVTKTADESWQRDWTWDVEKDFTDFFINGGVTDLVCVPFGSEGNDQSCTASLLVGENLTVQYEVTISATGVDSNYRVQGNITVANGHPTRAATLTGVTDAIAGYGAAPVVCPALSVPAAGNLVCTYDSGPQAAPNPFGALNTATATQQLYDFDSSGSPTPDGTMDYQGTAPVAFAATPTVENNECADTNDVLAGFADETFGVEDPICASTFPNFEHTYSAYTRLFETPEACDGTFTNTATVTPNDGGTPANDSEQIVIECETGCTLTQGYWKTHSQQGPAPYADELWPLLGDYDGDGTEEEEEESLVGINGNTFIDNWNTPVGGNIWIKLAHQYQAAYLNWKANGESAPAAVEQALLDARALLEADANRRIRNGDANADEANALHSLLASYNEGGQGVPHCTENTLPFITAIYGS